ncbi:hypothetical protein Asppvi_008297 [Aspergillus pseudoviridinutans]|uniref:Uncharacterized protein n=1 Tax=Aspergillus pseudoviridinutans TaxID=1517512 RepID=A0A9P3BFU2_9EURO|nr:uncharacterized protein Asppvi_008297 [Aspergillus pseudoviridinutans]GIJ89359.1 hypothetical protein Asppvi_008297 [Aspergillus pseudoviridinutans]
MRKEVENLEESLWEESADAPSDLQTVNIEDARGGEKRETGVTGCQIKESSRGTLVPKLLVRIETMRMVSLGENGKGMEEGFEERRAAHPTDTGPPTANHPFSSKELDKPGMQRFTRLASRESSLAHVQKLNYNIWGTLDISPQRGRS